VKKTFDKLLKRNIFSNFKQFLSIVIIVFLATTLLSGFIVNSYTLENGVNNYFKDSNLADAWIYVDNISNEDEQFFNNLSNSKVCNQCGEILETSSCENCLNAKIHSNDLVYNKRLELSVVANLAGSNTQNNAKVFVYDKIKISAPYVFHDYNGCWIDESVAKNNNLKIGQDKILFNYEYVYDFNGVSQNIVLPFEFLITGTMALSECADTYSNWPILIDKTLFLNELNRLLNIEFSGAMAGITPINLTELTYNQILIKTQNLDKNIEKIVNYYENNTNSNIITILKQDSIESVVLLKNEIEQSKKMIYIFPTLFFVVSVLVMVCSINQLILQERTKIGTLKSVGADNKLLLRHYSQYGAWLCAIGAAAGLIVGPLLIPEIMFIKYNIVYSLPRDYIKLSYPMLPLFLIFVLIIFMGWITSLFVCRKIINKKPAWCLKPEIKSEFKAKIKHYNIPTSIKMAFRNIAMKPARVVMAVIGIAGCVALMISGFGIGDTLKNSIDNDLSRLFDYDVSSTFKNDDFIEKLNNFEEVDYVESYEKFYADLSHNEKVKKSNVYVICENSQVMSIKLTKGEAVISESVAEKLNLNSGDYVMILFNGHKVEVQIKSLIKTSLLNGLYVCGDYDFGDNYKTKGAWIKVNSNAYELADKLNLINGTNDAKTIEQMWKQAENKISSISVMTTTLKLFAFALAVVVLLNFVFLILKERNRQIATLKVLGQNLWSIVLAICFELIIISSIGLIVGMILGYPLLVLILTVNKVEIINFLYYISPLSFVLSALIIVFTLFLVALFLILKVKNINMIESLKIND